MLLKHCTQYANNFGKIIIGHRTGKHQFSFQSQRRALPKNAQTTAHHFADGVGEVQDGQPFTEERDVQKQLLDVLPWGQRGDQLSC